MAVTWVDMLGDNPQNRAADNYNEGKWRKEEEKRKANEVVKITFKEFNEITEQLKRIANALESKVMVEAQDGKENTKEETKAENI